MLFEAVVCKFLRLCDLVYFA